MTSNLPLIIHLFPLVPDCVWLHREMVFDLVIMLPTHTDMHIDFLWYWLSKQKIKTNTKKSTKHIQDQNHPHNNVSSQCNVFAKDFFSIQEK